MSGRLSAIVAFCALAFPLTHAAQAARLKHDMQIDMERRSGGLLTPFPGVTFTGVPQDFQIVAEADGVTTNPLYSDHGLSGDNPLFEDEGGPLRVSSVSSLSSITFELGPISFSQKDGIVHRDVAARNILLRSGDVGPIRWMAPESIAHFSSDGPTDYGAGPVTWTLLDDVELFVNGDPTAKSSDSWILHAGSTFTATVVPGAPTLIPLLAGAGALLKRRR